MLGLVCPACCTWTDLEPAYLINALTSLVPWSFSIVLRLVADQWHIIAKFVCGWSQVLSILLS